MAEATLRLLTDAVLLAGTRHRAYAYAKPMFWPNVGRLYLDFFGKVAAESRRASVLPLRKSWLFNGKSHREQLSHKGI
jgi:hypothetical protein